MSGLGVFAYGSLVAADSAAMTLGRPVPAPRPAELGGWRRRFTQARDNLRCEKTFALASGERPPWVLGLNVEPGEDDAGPVNGAVVEVTEEELARLATREIRYDAVDVTEETGGDGLPTRVWTFTAKHDHFAPEPPAGAVILATYAQAVEEAFAALAPDGRDRFLATTGPYPVDRVEAKLVRDEIPPGNPTRW